MATIRERQGRGGRRGPRAARRLRRGGRHRVPRADRRRDGRLRRALRAVGGDYKVFKNTLVRRAIEGSDHEPLSELLEGPTAIAFVHGDVSAVAKALRDFARSAPSLIVKGGVLDGALLDARELTVLADLPSREVLLAMLAGAIAAPLRTMAGLLKAVPQNFAYGLSALLDAKGGAPVAAEAPRCRGHRDRGRRGAGGRGRGWRRRPRPTRLATPRRRRPRRERGRRPSRRPRRLTPQPRGPRRSRATDRQRTSRRAASPSRRSSKKGRPPPWLEH